MPTARPGGDDAVTCAHGHDNPRHHRFCASCGVGLLADASPMWSSAADIRRVVAHPPHLRNTLVTTVIVGSVLFAINQLDVVLAGDASTSVWVKSALTYVVPFVVSNVGILIATHHSAAP